MVQVPDPPGAVQPGARLLNQLHHYRLGERHDPDVPELNKEWLHGLPRWVRLPMAFVLAATWKFVFYSPSNLRVHRLGQQGHRLLPTDISQRAPPEVRS